MRPGVASRPSSATLPVHKWSLVWTASKREVARGRCWRGTMCLRAAPRGSTAVLCPTPRAVNDRRFLSAATHAPMAGRGGVRWPEQRRRRRRKGGQRRLGGGGDDAGGGAASAAAALLEHITRSPRFFGPKYQMKWLKEPGYVAQYPRWKTSTALKKGPQAHAEYHFAWDFRASLGLRIPGTSWDCMDFGSLTGIHVA